MIRRAAPQDAAALARIHTAARAAWEFEPLSSATDEATWAERLAGTEAETFVCERDGAVRGFLSACDAEDDDLDARIGAVLAVYVDPAAQGGGVAGELLDAIAVERRSRGDEALVLWTDEGNGRARTFYERRGWVLDRVDGAELRYRRAL